MGNHTETSLDTRYQDRSPELQENPASGVETDGKQQ